MGYRIDYGAVKKVRGLEKRTSRVGALAGLFFLAFLLIVCSVWPRGTEVLREVFLPDTQALEVFAQQLRWGESFGDAAESFCRTVMENARIAAR